MAPADTISPTDCFIAVFGMTGAGKSHFISQCTGQPNIVGHGLQSFTKSASCYSFDQNGRTVHLIDCPGWADTDRADVETLREIAFWFAQWRPYGVRLDGIIWMHNIATNRMSGSAVQSLDIMKAICGPQAYGRVVLAASHSNEVPLDESERRLNELCSPQGYWGDICGSGGAVLRVGDDRASAINVINEILTRGSKCSTLLEEEFVDQRMSLERTTAGRKAAGQLAEILQEMERHRHELLQGLRVINEDHMHNMRESCREELAELRTQMDRQSMGLQALQVGSGRLVTDMQRALDVNEQTLKRHIEQTQREAIALRASVDRAAREAAAGQQQYDRALSAYDHRPPASRAPRQVRSTDHSRKLQDLKQQLKAKEEDAAEAHRLWQMKFSKKQLRVAKVGVAAGVTGTTIAAASVGITLATAMLCSVM